MKGLVFKVSLGGFGFSIAEISVALFRKDEGCICSTKAKAIGQNCVNLPLLGDFWHEINFCCHRWIVEIERRRADIVPDGEEREDRLDRPGGAEKMSDRRFRRGHRKPIRAIAHQSFDGAQFRTDIAADLIEFMNRQRAEKRAE